MQNSKTDSDTRQTLIQAELKLAGSLDKRLVNLLKAIDEHGSINQAAKQMGLSYKGAWQILEKANNLAPKILISTATGGSHGGGSSLTPAGQALLALFADLEQRHQAFLAQLNTELLNDHALFLLLKPLTIKTSATNQLFGTVSQIQAGSVNAEVSISLKGGEQIIASPAISELEAMTLTIGKPVVLLINAVEISLFSNPVNSRLSARNLLSGTVIRIQDDSVDAEIVVRLNDHDTLTAIITVTSARNLQLKPGSAVSLLFKSNAVILGAPA